MLNYSITLDTHKMGTQSVLNAKKYDADSRRIDIMLTENGMPFDVTKFYGTVYLTLPDGSIKDCKTKKYEDGFYFIIPSEACAVDGDVFGELRVYRGTKEFEGEVFASPRFRLKIEDAIDPTSSNGAISSMGELDSLLSEVKKYEDTFFNVRVVDELPTTNIDTHAIYLVPKRDEEAIVDVSEVAQ